MHNTFVAQKSGTIQWKQLWSLAALYGSVVIGWIAYQNYQPRLLEQFHFKQFTLPLAIAQAIILSITPLVAGRLGDRYRKTKGHRIPIIMAGMSFAAMIFMAVAFTLFANPGEILKWVLPVLIICWLVAMSIFTSPALSTIELFVPVQDLPIAMALLTIVANLLYSLEPVIVDIIDFVGAPFTFVTGGALVFASGYALRNTSLHLFRQRGGYENTDEEDNSVVSSPYVKIFLLGAALGVVTTVIFNFFPDILEHYLPGNFTGKIKIVGILIISACTSFFMTIPINRFGLRSVLLASIAILSVMMIIIFNTTVMPLLFAAVAVYGMAFTAFSVSALPLAMERSHASEKVFCVGIFFSGIALPDGIVNILLAWP